MRALDLPVTRRGVLLGLVAVAAACKAARPTVAPDRDELAMTAARQAELQIVQATNTTDPMYAVHVAHLKALGAPAPATPAAPPATTDRSAAVQASVATLQAAANAVGDGAKAAVLASIAASHAALGKAAR